MNKNKVKYRLNKTSFTSKILNFFALFVLHMLNLARAISTKNGKISIKKTILLSLTIISSIFLLFAITNALLITDTDSANYFSNGTFDSTSSGDGSGVINLGSSTGSLNSPWRINVNNYTTGREKQGGFIYNGYLYVVGGRNEGGSWITDVSYAPINLDGSVGAWLPTSPIITRAIAGSSPAVAYNGYAYVLGGGLNQFAQIYQNGSLSPWTVLVSNFSGISTTDMGGVAYKGYIYIIGGYITGYLNEVQYALIYANGTLGPWLATSNITSARADNPTVAYNDYIYTISGSGGPNNNEYAKILPNGSVGQWQTTTSLSTNRYTHAVAEYNGYLYVIGGLDTAGGNPAVSSVEVFPILQNGSLGAVFFTSSLPVASSRLGIGNTVYNGYIYKLGGTSSSGAFIEYSNVIFKNPGNFTSMIFDAGGSTTWNNISWIEEVPYGEEIGADPSDNLTGLVALYHLNNNSAIGENESNVTDSSGLGNHGTSSGTGVPRTNTTSKVFGAASKTFDGSNDFITSGTTSTYKFLHGALDTANFKFTIETWMKLPNPNPNADMYLISSSAAGSGSVGTSFIYEDRDAVRKRSISLWIPNGVAGQWVCDNTVCISNAYAYPNDNNWHHVAVTFDRSLSSGDAKFYVDGVFAGQGNEGPNGPSTADSTYSLHIGSTGDGTRFFSGSIDEVSIWNRSLSTAEIRNHYLRGALNLTLQVRSCDDAACNGESFVGPNNTADTFFRNATFGNLSNVVSNRWFQYKVYFTTMNISYTPILQEVNLNYGPLQNVNDETISNNAIVTGIQNVIPAATIYANQQIYVRNSSGSQMLGRFDRIAAFGNQRWAFNYINSGEQLTNITGLGNTLFIWENTSLTSPQITQQVQNLINKTKV